MTKVKTLFLGGCIFLSWFPVIVFVIIQSLPNQHEHTQVIITAENHGFNKIPIKFSYLRTLSSRPMTELSGIFDCHGRICDFLNFFLDGQNFFDPKVVFEQFSGDMNFQLGTKYN